MASKPAKATMATKATMMSRTMAGTVDVAVRAGRRRPGQVCGLDDAGAVEGRFAAMRSASMPAARALSLPDAADAVPAAVAS